MTSTTTSSTRSLPRRALARGAAWAVPSIVVATAAPAYAASTTTCLSLFRESSGDINPCVMGLWTNSNIGGTTHPTTLQTKPLYDCRCTPSKSCQTSDPLMIYNVQVQFLIPTCYAISPQSSWQTDASGAPWTASLGTATNNGTTYQLLTVTYVSIPQYGSGGQQIQVPLSSKNCPPKSETIGSKIYSRMQGQCTLGGTTYSTAWTVIPTSGTSFV